VVYTFAGYAVLLSIIYFFKKLFSGRELFPEVKTQDFPKVCMFVTAYNESAYVRAKVENLLELDYPAGKLQFLWITDGSDDGTPDLLKKYPQMEVHHLPERKGKIHAMNRGMQFVDAPIVIFSDSNTTLCPEAVQIMVKTFGDTKVGCIAGEKRVISQKADGAAGTGENMYWKFESWVKQMDSELNTAVGAAGELFAIRTALYTEVENDSILDDFMISLRIAKKGYRIAYTPGAYAIETASVNVSEELKRKVRIAAGGLQTIGRLKELLNPFRYGWLSIQYISHKVLRWTIAPLALFLLYPVNLYLFLNEQYSGAFSFYAYFFFLQSSLYLLAFIGWIFERQKIRLKILFIPFYFTSINYASVLGWIRFLKGKQSVNWEKSKRA
jgi:cellulose synthase/poly-beta-1,6-N-acetylglucosamine synthase-like glycosyltransferase